MMKRLRAVLLTGCLSALLCACSQTAGIDTNTVIVDKKGTVTEVIVEDFSQPYYDVKELENDVERQISDYNTAAGDEEAVSLDKLELTEENVVFVNLKFKSNTDYAAFNEKELFVGTVADAYAGGYEFTSMQDVTQEGVVISAEDVLEKGDMNIVIFDEAQQIIVPSRICYISDGVSMVEEKRAINLNEGEKAFIIYE